MYRVILLVSLLFSMSFAQYSKSYSYNQAKRDFAVQDTDKYKVDNLELFSLKKLRDKKIFSEKMTLLREYKSKQFDFKSIIDTYPCDGLENNTTGTVYDVNVKSGEVICMFSNINELYAPIGLFSVYYPTIKKHYTIDYEKVEKEKKSILDKAKAQFKPLYDSVAEKARSVELANGKDYLSITQIMTASILTDTDIIDIQETRNTGKLQLKDNFTSKFILDESKGEYSDNSQYILTDAETIFEVYSRLSDVSMAYLFLLVVFFGMSGIGRVVFKAATDKVEKKNSADSHLSYGVGLFAGILLFFPTSDHENIKDATGTTVAQYEIMKTRYQDFEKTGYYLFSQWADEAAKAIIDVEMKSIIDKSGIGTREQLINVYAGNELNEKLVTFYTDYNSACKKNYDTEELTENENETSSIYSETQAAIFPTTENWAYATSLVNPSGRNYYTVYPQGLSQASAFNKALKVKEGNYPLLAFSSCGKAYHKINSYLDKKADYEKRLADLLPMDAKKDPIKINMLEKLIDFQYDLYRDWGYLSILGLPVTKMQTEYIGALYEARSSKVLEKLNSDIKQDDDATHMIMSSIPYMFIPGAGTVYNIVSDNGGKLGAMMGTATFGGATAGWLGLLGTVVGGAVGTVAGSGIGLFFAYIVGKTVLTLVPIIGIVMIGLVRFIIIMVKIFAFHFASLFLMPVMFARDNLGAISTFTMKIFATMLELPVFVLAVWLAITANSLIHSIGDIFSKKIILGMLENNEAQYAGVESTSWKFLGGNGELVQKLNIYIFDGFMEVAIGVFSIIIIYKLIITLHNTLFEVLEIKGSKSLDDTIESMRNEASGWGNKI